MQIDPDALSALVASATEGGNADTLALTTLTQAVLAVVPQVQRHQTAVTFAVVDAAARLVFVYRMPDAILASLGLAQKKAYTAVAMRSTTQALQSLVQPGQDLYQLETLSHGELVTFGGGVPLRNSTKVIGGVGVSGAPASQQDHLFAMMFADKIMKVSDRR
ncbi:GlcG/HbpS family heme-binding protein [Lacticaseibacillus sp. GG6-2]